MCVHAHTTYSLILAPASKTFIPRLPNPKSQALSPRPRVYKTRHGLGFRV